ncbi:histidine utilization repressor [Undibacterium oligocarboniphilum]|uniref:Histidine utilization repressor n=1 Tax=Undibacterium oligocarboniphilum TaxID=666702 RepID=A0A850QC52_9BURK|nr:histidine utilization repressor [Undibacterium oligocarboniphilum]NVO77151.1 histidine utilization repressor [Undibacterium oligocarboniphilum]
MLCSLISPCKSVSEFIYFSRNHVSTSQASAPAFQTIKDYLLREIQSGTWKEGQAIPSEAMLAEQFSVSRMTVNRAVRELTSEQILNRIQGSGTYVAQQKYQATLVEIKSIADEIRSRGHVHRSELHELSESPANEQLAAEFLVKPGHRLFHSVIVHFENDVAIQVEDRWVNSSVTPDYLAQDFSKMTPNEYLVAVAPLQGVDYLIEATLPPKQIADMLHISIKEACLVLRRKTRSQGKIATSVTMWHPGRHYQFAGSF